MGWTEELNINEYGTLARQCTDKQLYMSRRDAKQAAKSATQRNGTKYRHYLCRICNGYHLYRVKRRRDQ
jgi:hypothetical protein